ncbi:hypothetical protein EGH22_20295 [Halomicroarcula sp. F28]|uniref:hypothetical protein n=1 Tax=Haloarcula salinisoli TaxID=2487746 RepID=UPI001C72E93D|nr:hypothetical protein [Halomicroarcula salinisoli]MBX0288674.1 hypothetical protein [Halomicroarcula salinisoli]
MALIERECWPHVEARRVEEGLRHARFWQRVEPHKHGFWEVFDGTVLAHYPECRFKMDDQLTLGEFSAAAE